MSESMPESNCPAACPAKLWCAVSGGKDSFAAAHVLADQGRLEGVSFIDTGLSIPGLEDFVRRTALKENWKFEVYHTPSDAYEGFVRTWGFPGPAKHDAIKNLLKGRRVRDFAKAHPGEWLASGVRSQESSRRFRNVQPTSVWEGVNMMAPIHDWSDKQVWAYVKEHGIKVSPAYETLHLSGDCLCGAMSEPDEAYLIETFYPEIGKRIRNLEVELRYSDISPLYGVWGHGRGNGFLQKRIDGPCDSCEVG